MDQLRQLLLEKGRVGKVLEILRRSGQPDPASDLAHALLYGHALCLSGDYKQALNVYTAVALDDEHKAERLWGLANASVRLGDQKKAASLLSEALNSTPPKWLCPQIYISLIYFHINQGQFEEAERTIEKGIAAASQGNCLIDQLILEGNRGVIKICQGAYEEAASRFENVIKPLLIRDSVLAAAHFLINLSSVYQTLGASDKAETCLDKAEKLIEESGSRGRMIFLRQVQGNFWKGQIASEQSRMGFQGSLGVEPRVSRCQVRDPDLVQPGRDLFRKRRRGVSHELGRKRLCQGPGPGAFSPV